MPQRKSPRLFPARAQITTLSASDPNLTKFRKLSMGIFSCRLDCCAQTLAVPHHAKAANVYFLNQNRRLSTFRSLEYHGVGCALVGLFNALDGHIYTGKLANHGADGAIDAVHDGSVLALLAHPEAPQRPTHGPTDDPPDSHFPSSRRTQASHGRTTSICEMWKAEGMNSRTVAEL